MSEDSQQPMAKTVGEVYALIGWGRYHRTLFVVCGLAWTADSIQSGLLSFMKQEVVKEWDLSTEKLSFLQNLFFIGEIFGCLLWGPLADRFGRKTAFLVANLSLASFAIAVAASPSFEWLVFFQFFVGMCISGVVVPFDTLLECCDPSITDQVTFGVQYFWTFGTIYVNLLAALILPHDVIDLPFAFGKLQPWRALAVIAVLPIILACLGYAFIEESPLWLQDQGRQGEALETLRRIARRSNVNIDRVTLLPLPPAHEETPPSLCKVVRWPYLRRTVSLCVIYLFGLMGYYGASLADPYIFAKPSGSTNYGLILFSACGEMFGVLVMSLVCRKVSLLNSLSFFFAMAGVVICLVLLKGNVPLTTLAMIVFVARACCMSCSCGYFLAAPKAYPTSIRCTAHAFVNLFGRGGGFLASVAGNFMNINVQLAIYGAANIICAITTFASRNLLLAEEQALESSSGKLGGQLSQPFNCPESVDDSGPRPLSYEGQITS